MSRLLLVAASFTLLLSIAIVPAIFTIDEASYLSTVVGLRHGRLTLPGTDEIKPSDELSHFNPIDRWRVAAPPPPVAPPLYAFIALPFSYAGIRGLFAVNAIAYFMTIVMIFVYARRYAQKTYTPWLAAGTFALAGFTIEYAQGLWPHMLAVALCMGAFLLGESARKGAAWYVVAGSGFLAGLSAGIRYQNVFFAGCLGLTVLLWAPRRLRSAAFYASGIAVPLACSSVLNRLRQGSWNPISKGQGYLSSLVDTITEGNADRVDTSLVSRVADPFLAFWAKVVDFTAHPSMKPKVNFAIEHAPFTGAVVYAGGVKKALLQSSPWIVVAIFVMLLAWRFKLISEERARNELRVSSLIVWPVLLLFSAVGFSRSDGLCFNQRYFLELVPLLAVAFAWTVERHEPSFKPFMVGGLVSLVFGVVFTSLVPSLLGDYAILRVPHVLAILLLFYWLVDYRVERRKVLSVLFGASLAWATVVHIGDDLVASRTLRIRSAVTTDILDDNLPREGPIAVFEWRTNGRVAFLQLKRDLVILDAARDMGKDAPVLAGQFIERGRRVFIFANRFPGDVLERILAGREARGIRDRGLLLIEVMEASGRRSSGATTDDYSRSVPYRRQKPFG